MSDFFKDLEKVKGRLPALVNYCSRFYKGDKGEGQGLLHDAIIKVYKKYASGTLDYDEKKLVGYLKITALNIFREEYRRKHYKFIIPGGGLGVMQHVDLDKLLSEEWLENVSTTQKNFVLQGNANYILNHLDDYGVSNEIVKRVLQGRFNGLSYLEIVDELSEAGIKRTVNNLTVMYKRAIEKLRENIKTKHPYFSTEII